MAYSPRMHGYFIGGLLPAWFGGDGLLMQKVLCETDWEGIALYSERAKRIAEIVRNDQKKVKYNKFKRTSLLCGRWLTDL